MKLKEHRPLRGNWAHVAEHAANGQSATSLSRSEIIKNINSAKNRSEIFENFRAKFARPTRRVANVRKVNGGFHVIGLGVQPLSMNELKVKLGLRLGASAIRMGGLKFNI